MVYQGYSLKIRTLIFEFTKLNTRKQHLADNTITFQYKESNKKYVNVDVFNADYLLYILWIQNYKHRQYETKSAFI